MSSAAINPRLDIFDDYIPLRESDDDDTLSVEAYHFYNDREINPTTQRSRLDKRRRESPRLPRQPENSVLTVDMTDEELNVEEFLLTVAQESQEIDRPVEDSIAPPNVEEFFATVTQESQDIDSEDRIASPTFFEQNLTDVIVNGHPNGVAQAVDCSKNQYFLQAENVERDELSSKASADALSRIRKEYADSRIAKSKHAKHSEQLWAEFGELLRGAAASSQTVHLVTALVEEWRLLAQQAVCHTDESLRAKAREIVQGRQKRRKTKRGGYADVKYQVIQPWHIVLGDRCTRDRTLGTLVLRFHCFQLKQSNRRIDCEQLLSRTRSFLRLAFPSEHQNEVGRILYATGSRFVKPPDKVHEPVYAFGADEKTTFGSVSVEQELDVVKLLYTKISATERSLEDVVQAYRVVLQDRQACASNHSIQAFESLLDFVSQAAAQDLTQTAINGLRESLDAKWDDLFGS